MPVNAALTAMERIGNLCPNATGPEGRHNSTQLARDAKGFGVEGQSGGCARTLLIAGLHRCTASSPCSGAGKEGVAAEGKRIGIGTSSLMFMRMDNPDETLKQINKSGFPFQLRIQQEIRASHSEHGWELASREHPWRDPNSEASGFIDLTLHHTKYPGDRLVIECKRVKTGDSRQLQWIFLLPDEGGKPTSQASCFEVGGGFKQLLGTTRWIEQRLWDNVRASPNSLESEFCILSTDDSKRQPILEALCAGVLESVEGLAQEEVRIQQSQNSDRFLRFIFPVIVTNASLTVCQFNSSDVKITDGTLNVDAIKLDRVPFIRFRKSLATQFPNGKFVALEDAHRARERSVYIVNAEGLLEFLKGWEVQGTSREFAIYEFAKKHDLWP
jgi:hypothetical protein